MTRRLFLSLLALLPASCRPKPSIGEIEADLIRRGLLVPSNYRIKYQCAYQAMDSRRAVERETGKPAPERE